MKRKGIVEKINQKNSVFVKVIIQTRPIKNILANIVTVLIILDLNKQTNFSNQYFHRIKYTEIAQYINIIQDKGKSL